MNLRKLFLIFCVTLGTLLLSACKSSTHDQPSGTAAGHDSFVIYKLIPADSLNFANSGDRAHNKVQNLIRNAFTSNGLREKPAAPDLVVSYLIAASSNAGTDELKTIYSNSDYALIRYANEQNVTIVERNVPETYDAGSIIIDIYDVNSKKLIYRNHASRAMSPETPIQERYALAEEAVTQALAEFFNTDR
ncbi:DUF4136 domain-containing protein [Coraliomargarita akajimensis]|uniref:DUF4136 domain-containing protein n=1 Tax=Coraliomargarita akajimensis (strain DSM 45221 / IAM 15411 / JCM 23193 / KCTC 12865 / 04OKA010-24) TaxID=583355 RepID=D5EJF9_CORAD|nr:DUF4136 domain-containing protein [Coraliomargarita akajimensis]ADE54558.1 hypothetical protein Caka_1539 [Coraliomargarita akajimensis DSM 45221]